MGDSHSGFTLRTKHCMRDPGAERIREGARASMSARGLGFKSQLHDLLLDPWEGHLTCLDLFHHLTTIYQITHHPTRIVDMIK